MSPQTRNALGLAAMHLAVTTSLNPPEVFEEAQVTSQRVRRWLMMLALMRHYGLNAAELATLLDMSPTGSGFAKKHCRRQLTPAIDPHVEDVLVVELEVNP